LIVELAVIVSRNHPLASKRGPVTLTDLRDERLIARPGSALSEALQQATGAHGFAPHVAIETSDFRLVYPFVAAGLGLAVVPRSAVEYNNDEVALLPIGPVPITRTVALAWATDRYLTPAMRGFLAVVSSRPGVPSRA
jgi:DNA-binding transcriptional LysR family regulator